MKVNPHIFRGYDLRGLVDKDLTPELVFGFGQAYGTYLQRLGVNQAVVGRDCRATSPEYSNQITRGLNWAGVNVTDIGMNLVGTFYWSQHHLKIPAGIYVSASHNPPEYNGFKFANDYSETLVSEGMQALRKQVEADDFEPGQSEGKTAKDDILEAYYADIVKRLPLKKRFKVVIDAGCSTASVSAPGLFRAAGCEVIEYNTKVDPSFPLGPVDPIETSVMERLRQEVLDNKADVGFTYDSDGDRIGVVDEVGNIIWNDVLVAIFAVDVLRDHPGATVMFNTLCSKVVSETILANGGKPFMWRTGHSFLKKKNQEVKAAFIGELSGHFFFSKDFYNHDDGLYTSMRLLKAIDRSGKKLSELLAALPKYQSSPEVKIYCADEEKTEVIKKLATQARKDYPKAEVIDDERAGDGIRLELPASMFVIRYSQNGPYITVKFEAKSSTEYDKLREYVSKILHNMPEIDWGSSINANAEALDKPA